MNNQKTKDIKESSTKTFIEMAKYFMWLEC